MKEEICFITTSNQGFLIGKLQHLFKKAGIGFCMCSDDTQAIRENSESLDIFLYYSGETYPRVDSAMNYLSNMCFEKHKSLYLIGDEGFLEKAIAADRCNIITHSYVHPVDSGQVVRDVKRRFIAHTEFNKRKDLMIVDDDGDFLELMDDWLGNNYDMIGVNTASEALDHIRDANCDLILMDYEISDMNGCQLMEKVRSNPLTADIPMIFLTDINDRESVMNIIRHRPDGYLLKTTRKTELLEVLERFFAETILGKG